MIPIRLGEWSGDLNFFIVSIDDFQVVLELGFVDQVFAFSLPTPNSINILARNKACVFQQSMLPKQSPTPRSQFQVIQVVLKASTDVMPREFPKRLLSRRELDHQTD